jgi:hypothetical protein
MRGVVTMTLPVAGAVADVWRSQRQWSNAASRLKKSIIIWRSTALTLTVAGAVLATLATRVGLKTEPGRDLSIVAAVTLVVVPIIRQARLGKNNIETWTRARSAAEGLKAETYLYLTRTSPYDGPDRDGQLTKETDYILRDVDDLAGYALSLPDADKPLPTVSDIGSYLTLRVKPQIDGYYRTGAFTQQRRLMLFRSVEFGLSLLAAALGVVAAVTHASGIGSWVAVATTVGAAITAHMAAARYEHLVISYLATARQLRTLVRNWRDGGDHSRGATGKFVRDCEDVISRENESWMAAWSRDEGRAAPAAGER